MNMQPRSTSNALTVRSSSSQPNLSISLLSVAVGIVAVALAGCAAQPAGISGFDAFVKSTPAEVLSGPKPFREVVACFEQQGVFLPLSEFSRDTSTQAPSSFTYRLRVSNLWFEQIRITDQADGSRAEMLIAPNLNAKWRAQFDRDRVAPLQRCLGT
jgi:hypothetical protein